MKRFPCPDNSLTVHDLYKENHSTGDHYLVCSCHLCHCCRHFTLAERLTALFSICKFHNSFQCQRLCSLFTKHFHQAGLEGFQPVDRQNTLTLHANNHTTLHISALHAIEHFLMITQQSLRYSSVSWFMWTLCASWSASSHSIQQGIPHFTDPLAMPQPFHSDLKKKYASVSSAMHAAWPN